MPVNDPTLDRRHFLGTATATAALASSITLAHAEPPASEWKLVWSDEFDGKEIDRTKWDFDIGNGFFNYDANQWISGWGNNELQYYTREPDNAFVKDGMLHVRVLKESLHGCGYTSARLKTRKKDGSELFSKKYGRFEFRAKLPTGKGVWPALWMLPQEEKYGGWAASGEIDVLEVRGQEPNKVLGTLHFGSRWPANAEASSTYELPDKGTVADFHTYALEWEPGEIRLSVDGRLYATKSFWWSSSKIGGGKGLNPAGEADLEPWPAPFDQPFYLIVNVAVGGKFAGNPDKTTAFPVEMVLDYIRVYDKVGGYGKAKPRGEGKLPFAKP
ncbi:MAG: glycoside hydrolase family 16 protein [Planctomycetes bacterium]|nr:glycoside hydrolase family 16 protein [Planctomycetota bacterium]